MIILKTLIKFNVLLQAAIPILTNDTTKYREAFYTGLSDAIFYYLSMQKLTRYIPFNPSVGLVATAPTPVPGTGFAAIETSIPSKGTLKDYFMNQVVSPFPLPNPLLHTLMFTSLAQWLNSPMQCKIGSTSIPPTMTGTGVTLFPLMPFLGIPCWVTLLGMGLAGKINGPDDLFEVLSNFIYMGLLANFTAPIATFGTAIPPTGAYSGATIVLPWIILDVLIGSSTGSTVPAADLATLGLTGIIDENGEILDEEALKNYQTSLIPQPTITPGVNDLIFNGNNFEQPIYTDPTIEEINNTGALSIITDPTQQQILTSAGINDININYGTTSADNKVSTFMHELSSTVPEFSAAPNTSANVPPSQYYKPVNSITINISIGSPKIITGYITPIIPGSPKTSVFEVF